MKFTVKELVEFWFKLLDEELLMEGNTSEPCAEVLWQQNHG